MDDLTRVLQSLGKLVSGQDATAENLRMAAEAVRTKSDQVVRPLSHKIWMDSKVSAPKARLSEVSKQAIIYLDYSLGRVLAIEAMFFLGLVSVYSIERVLLASLVLPLVALFSIAFRPKNQNRNHSRAALINFVFLVAISTIPIFVDDLLAQLAGFNSALFPVNLFTLIAPLWLGVIIVFDSSLAVLRKSRAALVEELEKQKASAPETGDEDLAGFLHNSLQSELTVLSLQLQAASESKNPTDARAAWEQLGAWINKSVSEDFENSTVDPASRAFGSIAAWRGIADVQINISPETFSGHPMASLLVQVIEESISNSVRHLKATKITFHFDPGNVDQLIIETNGRLSETAPLGIGTFWLNSISLQPTELVATANGTRSVIDL
jgi:signal transduction histidine kinase